MVLFCEGVFLRGRKRGGHGEDGGFVLGIEERGKEFLLVVTGMNDLKCGWSAIS